MLVLTSNKKKFNPWKAGVWLAEHPYVTILLLCLLGGSLFFLLSYAWEYFIIATLITWGIAAIMIVLGGGFLALDFFFEDRHEEVARWFRRKAREFEQVEDKTPTDRVDQGHPPGVY